MLGFFLEDVACLLKWVGVDCSDPLEAFGSTACAESVPCVGSGAATPKNVATASQELRSLDGSDFGFAGSTGCATASSVGEDSTTLGGFDAFSVFLVVGLSEGVLSKFAMLFQWSDMSKSFRGAAAHTRM
jgi:hypothetical protein